MTNSISVDFADPRGKTSGTFTRGSTTSSTPKPLLVLIHGGGVNSSYFENDIHSIPTDFNKVGFDVLNINRVGYGENPIQKTETPIFDSIPLYSKFINDVYQKHHGGKGGVILIGHSLGAAVSIIIAALEGKSLPLLGVSALGIVPTKDPLRGIVDAVNASPQSDRIELGQPTEEYLHRFLGVPEFFDISKFPQLTPIYQAAPRNELVEWLNRSTYDRFVNEVAPAVEVPLQYLAAEIEVQWAGIGEGRPLFEEAKKLFTKVPRLDADILLGGAHNYEFSTNSDRLRDRRVEFIESLV